MPATPSQPLDSVEVLLVRHGQTAWNVERRFLGRTDVPLDDVGRAQAARVGAHLRALAPVAVYSSPLARAVETAAAVAPPVLLPGFAEMDMGELEGLSAPACQARWPDLLLRWRDAPGDVAIPGGETLLQVQARAHAAFLDLVARHGAGERVVVVTHQLALASLLCALAGRPLDTFRDFGHRNGAYAVVHAGPRVVVAAVDQGPHLDP